MVGWLGLGVGSISGTESASSLSAGAAAPPGGPRQLRVV